MKKTLILLFFIIFSSVASAQQMDRVKLTINALCAPEMHGRGYTRNGDRNAAAYIAQRFKELGLLAFPSGTTASNPYFQPFPLTVNTFPGNMQLSLDKTQLSPGKDYIINPISSKGKGKGSIYLLDTAIFANSLVAQRQLMAENLSNKVVVYREKDHIRLTQLPLTFMEKVYSGKGVIQLKDKLTMSISDRPLSKPNFEMLTSKFNPAAKKVKFKVDQQVLENYQSQNVIGYIKGTVKPDSFVVISAHYDHLGEMGKDTYFPGANDNASGTSMLLELAAHYATNKPAYSMVFMAFSGEEAGLIGSKFYTENPLFPLKNIRFMINLDLVGTGDDGMMVVNGMVFQEEFALLEKINKQNNYLSKVGKRGYAANSDHYFFTQKGVRAFFIYTLGGIQAYHDVFDRPETLPLTKYTEVFKLLTEFVKALE